MTARGRGAPDPPAFSPGKFARPEDPAAVSRDMGSDSPDGPLDPRSEYYMIGGIPVISFIRAKLTKEQLTGYLLGNVLKYAGRLNYKGSALRDAEKMSYYSAWLEDHLRDLDDPDNGLTGPVPPTYP